MHNSCLKIFTKYLTFRNALKPIIDLCSISFLCANFETFTIFSAIVLKTCTYPPYYMSFIILHVGCSVSICDEAMHYQPFRNFYTKIDCQVWAPTCMFESSWVRLLFTIIWSMLYSITILLQVFILSTW